MGFSLFCLFVLVVGLWLEVAPLGFARIRIGSRGTSPRCNTDYFRYSNFYDKNCSNEYLRMQQISPMEVRNKIK